MLSSRRFVLFVIFSGILFGRYSCFGRGRPVPGHRMRGVRGFRMVRDFVYSVLFHCCSYIQDLNIFPSTCNLVRFNNLVNIWDNRCYCLKLV